MLFKRQVVEDERIINEHRRYNSEALSIIFWALLIDVFYRSVILRQELMVYWDIGLIFFGTSFFLVVRKVGAGIFAFEGMKKGWAKIISSSLVAGVTITATLYYLGMERSVGTLFVNFLIGTGTFGALMALFYYLSNRRADK